MAGKNSDLEIVIGADLGGLASDLSRGAQLHKNFAREVERNSPRASDLTPRIDTSGYSRAALAIEKTGRSVRSTGASLAGFGAKVAVAGGSLLALEAGLSGIGSALEQVKGSVVLAAEFEQNQIAFEAMLGSAQRATGVMADLRKFAAETPFSSKDVTDGARQLLAYGFAADELIPSLKTIGTLAAASAKPLGELVYNVGTTKVQGRAMQLDINQLTDKGIDVYPGLAKALKVDQAAVRKFVEEGRVDWNVYKGVLEELARTRFSGLLEKQADSLKGSWEQLTDAFDRAKLKLGQVIAQEAGLRGTAKDLEGFAGRIERALDGDRFRGAVRFIGDLAKGGAQLAHEFGQAGLEIARINLDGLTRTSPELARLAKDAQAFAASLKDFKLDKLAVAEFGLSLFEYLATPLADVVDWVKVEGKGYADAFQQNFVEPIKEALGYWREFKDDAKAVKQFVIDQLPNTMPGDLKAEIDAYKANRAYFRDIGVTVPSEKAFDRQMLAEAVELAKASQDRAVYAAPRKDEPAAQVLERFNRIQDLIHKGQFLVEVSGWKQFQPFVHELQMQRGEFLRPYSPDPGRDFAKLRGEFEAGRVPARRGDYADPVVLPTRTARETLQDRIAQFRDMIPPGIRTANIRAGFGQMFDAIRRDRATAGALGTQLSLAPLGPFGGLAPDLAGKKKDDLYLPPDNRTPAHLVDLAAKLNDQFAGSGLSNRLADLKALLDKGLINSGVYGKARDASVREVADRLGINQPARLPDTVLAGSQEDARLLAQAMGGQQQKTTEDLLKAIEQHLRSIRESNNAMERQRPQVLGFGWAGL